MTLTSHTAPTGANAPRPPFDPEIEVVLQVLADVLPPAITPDLIPLLRQPNPVSPPATDEELSRVQGRTVRSAGDLPQLPTLAVATASYQQ